VQYSLPLSPSSRRKNAIWLIIDARTGATDARFKAVRFAASDLSSDTPAEIIDALRFLPLASSSFDPEFAMLLASAAPTPAKLVAPKMLISD